MPVVAWAGEHGIFPAYFPRKKHAVAIAGQKGVFQLVVGFKIIGVGNADCGAVITVAPGHVIAVLNKAYPRVVAVNESSDFAVGTQKSDGFRIEIPMDSILAASGMQPHLA